MNGTIRLYSHNDNRIRTEFYTSKEHRNKIIARWMEYYEPQAGVLFDQWYFRVSPFIHIGMVINMKSTEFINKQKKVINRTTQDIEMPDFVQMGPFKHETYFHRCYYKNE